MLVVNFLGGPNIGKTGLRALVFAELRLLYTGLVIEEAVEKVKEAIYENHQAFFQNRILLLGEQFQRVQRYKNQADIVLTDAPALLDCVYGKNSCMPTSYTDLCLWAHKQNPSLNILLTRDDRSFEPMGRMGTGEQAVKVDEQILNLLIDNNINYIKAEFNRKDAICIANFIQKEFKLLC